MILHILEMDWLAYIEHSRFLTLFSISHLTKSVNKPLFWIRSPLVAVFHFFAPLPLSFSFFFLFFFFPYPLSPTQHILALYYSLFNQHHHHLWHHTTILHWILYIAPNCMGGTFRWQTCSTSDFPLKRSKVVEACQLCRTKKMRCDGSKSSTFKRNHGS